MITQTYHKLLSYGEKYGRELYQDGAVKIVLSARPVEADEKLCRKNHTELTMNMTNTLALP